MMAVKRYNKSVGISVLIREIDFKEGKKDGKKSKKKNRRKKSKNGTIDQKNAAQFIWWSEKFPINWLNSVTAH